MSKEKQIHVLYARECNEFADETLHFIVAYGDEEKAKKALTKLKTKARDLNSRFQKWYKTERREALDTRPPGESIWDCLERIEPTSPAYEWIVKDAKGEKISFQAEFYLETIPQL